MRGFLNKEMNTARNIAVIALLGIVSYFNSLWNNFVWDDIFLIIQNDFIKGSRLIPQLFLKPLYYLSGHDYLYYRPLQGLSYVFDYMLFGINPFGFHLLNLLLHILAAIMVYRLIAILFSDKELALFSALLFTVHPINTSVVDYIASRADILLAIFIISSLIFFIRAKNIWFYLFSLTCFIFALLSKEVAVIFPLCLIFTQESYAKIAKKNTGLKRARLWYISFIALSFAYVLFRQKFLAFGFFALPTSQISIRTIVLTLSKITLGYLRLIYWPVNLHMLRNVGVIKAGQPLVWVYMLFIILGAGIVLKNLKNRIIFFSLGFFILWLIPVCALAFKNPEYYLQGAAMMEEHWLYIPAIGIFLGTAYLLKKAKKYTGKVFYRILLLLIIACLSGITWQENARWKNNHTLFSYTYKCVNNSVTLCRNLGWIYLQRKDINNSIKMYLEARRIAREERQKAIVDKDLAYAYILNNQKDEALALCRQALKINARYADMHALLGLIYARDNLKESKEELQAALEIDPFNALSFNRLLALSRTEKDIRDDLPKRYTNLLRDSRGFGRYRIQRALGIIYLYQGEMELAFLHLKEAQRLNPYDPKINNALAVYYAQNLDRKKALDFFYRALKIDPFDQDIYRNLSLFYEESGQKEEAIRARKQAEEINIFN